MKGILKEELGRAFRSRRYWVVIVLILASIVGSWYRVHALPNMYSINPVNLLPVMLGSPSLAPLTALMATLPFADSLLDDQNSGFLRAITLRTSYRRYLRAKFLAVAFSGGISVMGWLLLTFSITLFINQTDLTNPNFVSLTTLQPTTPWGPLGNLYAINPLCYLGFLLVTAFVFGAVYALMGLAVSALVNNRYVVLAAPLVYYQLLSFLETRSVRLPPALNPEYTLLPFNAYENFTLSNMVFQYVFLLAAGVICLALFAKRSRMVQ